MALPPLPKITSVPAPTMTHNGACLSCDYRVVARSPRAVAEALDDHTARGCRPPEES